VFACGCSYDISEWTDKQLTKKIVHAVARLLHVETKAVKKCVGWLCAHTYYMLHPGVPSWISLLVRGWSRSRALAAQMDSLTLAQLQGLLARDFGLHIGNGEMFSEDTSIKWIVANRLVRHCVGKRKRGVSVLLHPASACCNLRWCFASHADQGSPAGPATVHKPG